MCTRKIKININGTEKKIEVFTKKGLQLLEFEDWEIDLIMKYQKQLPQLTQEDNGGFIVDGETLCIELKVKDNHNKWLLEDRKDDKGRIKSQGKLIRCRCKEGVDYHLGESPTVAKGTPRRIISLTLDCAKKIAMRQNNEMGDLVCDYFIKMEAAIKRNIKRINTREPQKPLNKEINSKLKARYKEKYGTRPENEYIYTSNADLINIMLFGTTAKNLNGVFKAPNDGKTRDRVVISCLERLTFMLKQHILLLDMEFDFAQREQMLLKMCKAKYGNKINPLTGKVSEIDYVRPHWWGKKYLI
ncbi:MAG: hypothetical protein GY714_23415 [Desulfobacterales bacterium]|nr:hypothetical protein [Desulfobacterales bacterium]